MIKSEKVSARNFEWLEDSIRAGAANNLVEGAAAVTSSIGQPTVRSNQTQIIGEAFEVSDTVEVVAKHGRGAKESAYALAKTLKSLKLDVEFAMIGVDQAAVAAGDASTARKMASASKQISTTVDGGGDALTEADILSLHQTCYENGSDVDTLMVKPSDASVISTFAAAASRTRDFGQSKTITQSVEILITSFGTVRVVINRSCLNSVAYLLDGSMFKQCVLRPFSRTLLARDGDSSKHFVVGEISLKHSNFGDSGMVTNIT